MADKLGLALSGGGFRAALFHLGVMAQLARRGVLPRVRVLSTVSGGSILGAHYVLALERELSKREPDRMEPADYVDLIGSLETELLATAQFDLRMHTFSNLISNLKMIRSSYSRSDRMGEILDREFFCKALNGKRGARGAKVPLKSLHEIEQKRGDKVPHLIMNATSLNTGHSWRFEGETMGEWTPRSPQEWDVDRSAVYGRPKSFDDMTKTKESFSLGKAVAASAAVPGLFHPLAVTGLYEDQLQLVDGGVFDNQGIDALLDAGCTHIIVSDAGGQLGSTRMAPTSFLGVSLRSAGIQYGRIRQITLERLEQQPGRERVAIVHTRLGVRPISHPWRREDGEFASIPSAEIPSAEHEPVKEEVQEPLSDIRTDLDVFNDVESMALMLSGYMQADDVLGQAADDVLQGTPMDVREFRFERLRPFMTKEPAGSFARLITAGKSRFFKLLRLAPVRSVLLSVPVYAPVIGIVLGLGWLAQRFGFQALRDAPVIGDAIQGLADIFATRPVWWALVSFVTGLLLTYFGARYVSWAQRLPVVGHQLGIVTSVVKAVSLIARALVAVLAFFVVWPSMLLFDPLYKSVGAFERLESNGAQRRAP
jgi:predicted acylesterase/phospholipase RssA